MKEIYKVFTVYDCGRKLVRFGCNYDGGYIVADCGTYDKLISCGIGHNVSFEMDFRRLCPTAPIRMYDPCIDKFPKRGAALLESGGVWKRLLVSSESKKGHTNLHSQLLLSGDVLLKMDIEGSEVSWIEQLDEEYLHRIKQAVIEFHNIKPATLAAISKLLKTHVLVHLHGNNYAGEKVDGDFRITRAYEMTLLRKSEVKKLSPYQGPLPRPELDFPNNRNRPQYDLNRFPFTKGSPTP